MHGASTPTMQHMGEDNLQLPQYRAKKAPLGVTYLSNQKYCIHVQHFNMEYFSFAYPVNCTGFLHINLLLGTTTFLFVPPLEPYAFPTETIRCKERFLARHRRCYTSTHTTKRMFPPEHRMQKRVCQKASVAEGAYTPPRQ